VIESRFARRIRGTLKPKFKFAVGAGIIVVALSCLAWVGARDSKTYYHTIPELSMLQGSARGARIRVGGDVAAGSIAHRDGGVDFVLTEQGQTLPVSYVGSEDGAQCLVEGHEMPDGHFVAETIQAKCASKYEAAPGGVLPPANSGQPAASGQPAGTTAATAGPPAS
jgi:cytochrome c-type biogenesis protein CcmE